MDLYGNLIRPALFRLDPERAHQIALAALSLGLPWWLLESTLQSTDPRLRTRLADIDLMNPVGIAPGLDKGATAIRGLSRLGFGYLVVGSFTVQPRAGNPRPRLLREPRRQAIMNSLGLPNPGLRVAVRRLTAVAPGRVPIIASVAGFSADELLEGARGVEPYVRAVEIGLICPNTTAEEQADELDKLQAVARGLRSQRRRPVFVKLPPFHDDAERDHILRMVDVCADAGLDGLSVSGTMRIVHPGLAMGSGGMAGRPVFEETVRNVTAIARHAHGRLAIKASGGVFTGTHARTLLAAGADAVEVYSAFIYRGPTTARLLNRELLALLGPTTVRELRDGAGAADTGSGAQPVTRDSESVSAGVD